jgi:hypothetical protein
MRRIGESADLRMRREGAARTETKCLMGSERLRLNCINIMDEVWHNKKRTNLCFAPAPICLRFSFIEVLFVQLHLHSQNRLFKFLFLRICLRWVPSMLQQTEIMLTLFLFPWSENTGERM